MCELLAVASDEARSLTRLVPWAMALESGGLAGFGWGIAWRTPDGRIQGYRTERSMREDVGGLELLQDLASDRFLIHLRRPSKLSTVGEPDSQPFVSADRTFALCHNGYFERADDRRGDYGERLAGRADSEVGYLAFSELRAQGVPVAEALPKVNEDLDGRSNLAVLEASGTITVMARLSFNPMWAFEHEGCVIATTSLSSQDESVFDMVYGGVTGQWQLNDVVTLGGPA
jgi:predicted glutamine amidotransferase